MITKRSLPSSSSSVSKRDGDKSWRLRNATLLIDPLLSFSTPVGHSGHRNWQIDAGSMPMTYGRDRTSVAAVQVSYLARRKLTYADRSDFRNRIGVLRGSPRGPRQ